MKDCFKDLFDSFIFMLLFLGVIVFICFICFSIYEVFILKNMNALGFFGSIIGGSLTLVGVWWTLNNQEKNRKEDLAIQYKPLCSIEILDKGKEHFNKCNNGFYCFSIPFRLKNVGRGEIYISDIKIERKYNDVYICTSPYYREIDLLAPSEYYESYISFSLSDSDVTSMREEYTSNIILSLRFTITGHDLNKNKIKPLIISKEYYSDNGIFKPYYPTDLNKIS